MKKLLLVLLFLTGGIASASAACGGSTAQMKDNASATFNMALVNDPSGSNCASIQSSAAAQAVVSAGNTINGVTANTTGTSVPVTGYASALINVNCTVTCSGGTTVVFQGSDVSGFPGTATVANVAAMPVLGATGMVGTVTPTTGSTLYCIPNFGYTNLRANVATYSAGTVSVTITPINGSACDLTQVANTTPLGQAVAGSSSPVVLPAAQVTTDPCSLLTKQGAPINLTASGQVITGTSAKKTYICSIDIVSATAQNIALVEGTGTTCATNIFGLAGGTTAATGWNLAANGGVSKGSGSGTVYIGSGDANATAANLCLLLSSTGQTSGEITYVQQ